MCVLNSDCQSPLACAIGKCHEQCAKASDCSSGATCVNVSVVPGVTAGVCQLPAEEGCVFASDCPDPLVCALDRRCRNQCNEDKDCGFPGLRCADHACALPADVTVGADGLVHLKNADGSAPAEDGGDAGTATDGAANDAADAPASGDAGDASLGSDAGAADAGSGAADGSGDGSDGPPPFTVTAVAAPPVVRQGAGASAATITVTAPSGLSHATGFSLGGVGVRALAGGTDSMLTLTVTVPHGAALGAKTLTFTSDGGQASVAGVIQVSAITSCPIGVDSDDGTFAAPYRSLKQALSVAGSGDTVQLLDGTYDAADGEDWKAALPDKLTLVGETTDGTVVNGFAVGVPTNAYPLVPLGDATIGTLTVQGFANAVHLHAPGNVSLTDVVLAASTGYDVALEPTALNSTITISGTATILSSGLLVDPSASGVTVSVSDATFIPQTGNTAVDVEGDLSKLTLTNVGITRQAPPGTSCSPLVLLRGAGSTLTAMGGTWQQVGCSGDVLMFGGQGATASLTGTGLVTRGTAPIIESFNGMGGLNNSKLTLTSVTGDADIEIQGTMNSLALVDTHVTLSRGNVLVSGNLTLTRAIVEGPLDVLVEFSGATLLARGSTFKSYKMAALHVSSGHLDLGTMADMGNNTFQDIGNGTAVGIHDQSPVAGTCSGSTFDGVTPPAATITGPATMAPLYQLDGGNNSIAFY
jgi:hypothetical protein